MKLQWQSTASEVPHIVREALDALRPVAEPDPEAWTEKRSAYLMEVHRYAELHQGTNRDTLLPMAVTSPAFVRRRNWSGIRSLFNFNPKEVGYMALALKLMVAMALIFGGSAGTIAASQESLPGSPLYQIKLQLENWEIAHAGTSEDTARAAMAQAQVRVNEASRLSERGQAVPDEVAVRFQLQLALALQAGGELDEPAKSRVRADIAEMIAAQLQTMARLRAAQGGDPESDDALQAMIRTMEQTQAQLGQNSDDGHGSGPGPGDDDGIPDQHGTGPGADPGSGGGDDKEDGAGYGPGDGISDGEPDEEGEGYGPGPGDDGEDSGSYGPGDGISDGKPDDAGEGYGPGPDDDNGGSGPGDGTGDGEPDEDGEGYGSGPSDDGDDSGGYGPGDSTGDGEPDEDGEGYGPGSDDDSDGYGPGDGTGDGEPDEDGEGYGPGSDTGEEGACDGDCNPDHNPDGFTADGSSGGRR